MGPDDDNARVGETTACVCDGRREWRGARAVCRSARRGVRDDCGAATATAIAIATTTATATTINAHKWTLGDRAHFIDRNGNGNITIYAARMRRAYRESGYCGYRIRVSLPGYECVCIINARTPPRPAAAAADIPRTDAPADRGRT